MQYNVFLLMDAKLQFLSQIQMDYDLIKSQHPSDTKKKGFVVFLSLM